MLGNNGRNGFAVGLVAGICAASIVYIGIEASGRGTTLLNAAGYFIRLEDSLAQWLMTIFSVVAAVLLWLTFRATQGMARETKRIGEAQVRAYVSVDKLTVAVKMNENKVTFHLSFDLRNTGQSPALFVSGEFCSGYIDSKSYVIMPDVAAGGGYRPRLSITIDRNDLQFIPNKEEVLLPGRVTIWYADVFSTPGEKNIYSVSVTGIVPLIDGKVESLSTVNAEVANYRH